MFSDHSQAQMSLISPLSSLSSQMTALHQQTAIQIVTATAAEGASSFDVSSQQNDILADFVLDESFNIDFLLKNTTTTTTATINSNNSFNTSQSFSIESQAFFESLNCLDDHLHQSGQFDELDHDFIQSLDVHTLLDDAEAAVIQSPFEAMPTDEIHLEGDLEFQNLLESICNEVSVQDDANINSPSAEITYAQLTAMTPVTNMEESSMDFNGNLSLASVKSTDETTSWSFEDDASSSSSPCVSLKSKGRRVNQSSGSVTKIAKSKKESNKAAAERYRNKKQLEKLELFAECERHEQRNKELKAEIEEVQVELNFIKNLLVEALLSKKS